MDHPGLQFAERQLLTPLRNLLENFHLVPVLDLRYAEFALKHLVSETVHWP